MEQPTAVYQCRGGRRAEQDAASTRQTDKSGSGVRGDDPQGRPGGERAVIHLTDPQIPVAPPLKADRPFEGGHGKVFFSVDGRWAVKQFKLKEGRVHGETVQELLVRLTRIHGLLRDARDPRFTIAAPRATFDRVGNSEGFCYAMDRVPGSGKLLDNLCFDVYVFAGQVLKKGRSWRDYVRAARNVAAMMSLLEVRGVTHTDLSLKNIFVDLGAGLSALIDIDSCVEAGTAVLPRATPGFVAPELLQNETVASLNTMRYSMGIILMYMLLFRNVMEPMCDYSSDETAT